MAKKTPDEKADEWFGTYKETPRQGVKGFGHSTHKDIPEGITLSNVVHVSPAELVSHRLNEKFFKTESDEYFEKLTRDIKERGILVPLITKTNGTILAGHNRWKVAKDLGLSTVPLQKVINELSPRQEKEFLIKDNYLRRQLTASEKERLIRELYDEELKTEQRGGNRGNQYTRESKSAKGSIEPLVKKSKNLAEKVESETGIKKGTAKRIIAKIKKEDKQEIAEPNQQSEKPIEISQKEQKQKEVLTLKLTTIQKTKSVLKQKLKSTEKEEKIILKKLESLNS